MYSAGAERKGREGLEIMGGGVSRTWRVIEALSMNYIIWGREVSKKRERKRRGPRSKSSRS